MKKVKVLRNYLRISDEKRIELARNIVSKMSGNPLFATPDLPLADLTSKADDLEQKFLAAMGGGTVPTAELRVARLAIIDALEIEAKYVDRIAKGDELAVLSSGFFTTKQPNPKRLWELVVENGANPGELLCRCKAIAKAKSYAWQFSISDNAPDEDGWVWAGVSTKTKMGITNLDAGKYVWIRRCGVTPYGMTPWCDPVRIMVK